MNEYSIRIERCEECEDEPLVIAGYVNKERFYGRDIRPEEYDDLDNIVNEVLDIVKDMYEEEETRCSLKRE